MGWRENVSTQSYKNNVCVLEYYVHLLTIEHSLMQVAFSNRCMVTLDISMIFLHDTGVKNTKIQFSHASAVCVSVRRSHYYLE